MATSVRLDEQTDRLVKRLAYDEGRSKSDVIREAIHRYGENKTGARRLRSVLDMIRPYVGIDTSKGAALSENTGERFTEYVREKARTRWGITLASEKKARRR